MMKKIGLLSIALVLGSTTAGRADIIRLMCQLTGTDHPGRQDPIEERFEIDTTRKMVTKIDGCNKEIFTNTADDHVNGYHSTCPHASDPVLRSLEMSGPQPGAKYYVRIFSKRFEWGYDSPRSSDASEWDGMTNTLDWQSICKSCIRIMTSSKTYRCKAKSRR